MRGPVSAQFTAVLAGLFRRRGTRNNVVAVAVATPVAALLLGRLSGVPELGLFLAGLTAVLGCLVVPLATGGVDDAAGWFWARVPRRPVAVQTVRLSAGVFGQLVVLLVCVVPLVAVFGMPAQAVRIVVGVAAVAGGLALVAGQVVPWRDDRAVDQCAAYAVLTGLAAVAYWPMSKAGAALTGSTRVPDAAAALVLPVVALAIGAGAAVWLGLRRETAAHAS